LAGAALDGGGEGDRTSCEYPLHTRPVNNAFGCFNLANISTGKRMIARRPPWRKWTLM
jgi:hypothetical protein